MEASYIQSLEETIKLLSEIIALLCEEGIAY